MSDAQRTIDIVFKGVDKTSAAVQSAIGNTEKFAGSLESATQPFANAAIAAVKYEAALLATGAAITAFSIKAAGDFDSGFREIASLLDEPIESLGTFRQEILDYGSNSSSSLAQVNEAVYSAISAGVDYTDSLDAVRVAEQLAIAGKGELGSTLTLLVSSLNAYGLSTDEAARFSDALFTSVRLGQTTLPELNQSLQAVTGTAATLGVPFEEILAALAALTASGTPTAQAVTQINAVLAGILKPSQEASKVAAELGIQFNAQAVEADGLQGVLQSVVQATGGSQEQMSKLFPSVEALRAVFPLTGIAAEKFANNLTELQDAGGATEEAYNKLADSLTNVATRLGSSFDALTVAIGTPLLDNFSGVADALGQIFSVLGASFTDGELSAITEAIERDFDRLAESLRGISQALPEALSIADISGFTDGLGAIRESVSSLFGDLDLTDPQDLAEAINLLADGFKALSDFSGGVIESFGPVVQLIGDLATEADAGGDAMNELGKSFGFTLQANIAAGALGNLTSVLSDIAIVLIGARVAGGTAGAVGGFKALGAALAAGGPVILGITALTSGFVGLSAAINALQGKSADNFINSIPELFGGQDFSTYLVDGIFAIQDFIGATDKLQDVQVLPASIRTVPDDVTGLVDGLMDIQSEILGLNQAIDPKPLDNYVESLGGITEESEKTAKALDGFMSLDEARAYWDSLKTDSDRARESLDGFGESAEEVGGYVGAFSRPTDNVGGTFSVIASQSSAATDSLDKLADASADLRAELAIAAIEASGAIEVARIEADAARGVAAFESLALSITSSSDALDTLYGALADDNIRKFDKIDIRDNIEDEFKARMRAFEQQEKLTEAEIRLANARARSFERGDALITINGDGLQPHLEAFMFEILESIQVRVNQDGYNLLLGA